MNRNRLAQLRKELKAQDLNAMLVRFGSNVRYLSGYTGSNGMCYITRD
ncbi:MAG: aminopeptidase P family N-terminal domain-containing protein, partial [Candidatus Marinimicrobia bacterium]|nr:aminopeptidase P family N-terminal domain-containing protein [Candidatus Neomarinimicrobiota bacterium]